MIRLIHLTDLHLSSLDGLRLTAVRGKRWTGFLSWTRRRRHIHRREVLERLSEAVRAEEADQVMISGDLAQIGLESEIRQAADWLTNLAPPDRILLVPGNHDVYARDSWIAVRHHWAPWLPAGAEQPHSGYPLLREVGGVRLIGISSACVTPVFSARGALGRRQLQRLRGALRTARETGAPACVIIHHPPLPGMTRWRKALREVRTLRRLIGEYAPALVVCGHLHRNRATDHGRTRVFSTASASSAVDASYRVFELEQAKTGWRVRARLKTLDPVNEVVRIAEEREWTFVL